jgi:hypothetical protein
VDTLDRHVTPGVDGLERSQIRPAFIDRDRLGLAVLIDRLLEVALGCGLVTVGTQQEIDRLAGLVNGAI